MKLFLGVDGGQSSTVALIGDETGRVLGWGRGGPCNHVAAQEGRQRFAVAMQACLTAASLASGMDVNDATFEAACLGFSGGAADKETLSREFIRSKAFKITHDAEIALSGATGGEPGIIVIAGTGSIAFGKNAQGILGRAGGWGYLFGDEGGAFSIGRQALRAALAMEEGWGAKTALHRAILAYADASSANELLHRMYSEFSRQKVASWAPMVDEAAQAEDAVARSIVEEAASELAGLVHHVKARLFSAQETPAIAYVGGVFTSELLTRAWMAKVGPSARPPQFPPAAGALLEALRLGGSNAALSAVPLIKT